MDSLPFFNNSIHRDKSKPNVVLENLKKKENLKNPLSMLKTFTVWITANCGKFLETALPDHLIPLLRNLYAAQEATVRTRRGVTEWLKIGKRVCQGCLLSP